MPDTDARSVWRIVPDPSGRTVTSTLDEMQADAAIVDTTTRTRSTIRPLTTARSNDIYPRGQITRADPQEGSSLQRHLRRGNLPAVRLAVIALLALAAPAAAQQVDKQVVISIAGPELKGGILSEITWDGGVLLIQGVFALPSGNLDAHYFVVPLEPVSVQKRTEQTAASLKYWKVKASRVSPTGIGQIVAKSDTKMPQFGIGSLERRVNDAVEMGGTQTKSILRLGSLTLLERDGPEPYDGETWSWSPAELNRIAYVDQKGDLWVATADGRHAQRLLKGDFTLPAWSDDGRAIAVAEHKKEGSWEISLVHLPEAFRRSDR
jgi:hypothetical protein